MTRLKLLLILSTMPSEAFGWILNAIGSHIYPDGLGGFSDASQHAIEAARDEALVLLNAGDGDNL